MSEKIHTHHCQNQRNDIFCYREEDDDCLWLEAGDRFGGAVGEVNFCPFCGYAIEQTLINKLPAAALEPIDNGGLIPPATTLESNIWDK
jgi:hypothetical protein